MPGLGLLWARAVLLASSSVLPGPGWERLDDCHYFEGRYSDGDSIEVRRGGKHHVFRLYFVDCVEKNPLSRARRQVQARYFGLKDSERRALRAAYLARNFTREKLRESFTVYTRWQPVDFDGGDNPAVRAFVETAAGEDLSKLLVREGLAIIRHGDSAVSDHPKGPNREEISLDLRRAEVEAKARKRGAWGLARNGEDDEKEQTLLATDRKSLISCAGTRVKVRGRVGRIVELPGKRLTFINFSGNGRDDFVGIVGRNAHSRFLKRFPQGLEKALLDQNVLLRGVVTLYRGIPQIELQDPAQLQIELKSENNEAINKLKKPNDGRSLSFVALLREFD
jgi:endonuclease YncB( thermonuclease family)